MSKLTDVWEIFKEVDTRPLAAQAERPIFLAIAGARYAGKSTLIHALSFNAKPDERIVPAAIELTLNESARAQDADFLILVLDATRTEFSAEAKFFREWNDSDKRALVYYNKTDLAHDANQLGATLLQWKGAPTAFGSALDPLSLDREFVPRVLAALPEESLALARNFPIFRRAVARALVSDTARANAMYTLGTGVAEIIPVLDLPLNAADILVLTKNQALLIYKLGLALGLSTRWEDHLAEFGGAVGVGFLWRQIARQLVGLIPVIGIAPKVAIAYAGTVALGEAILFWYQTGKKISGQGMREMYANALARGKVIAHELMTHTPRGAPKKLKSGRKWLNRA